MDCRKGGVGSQGSQGSQGGEDNFSSIVIHTRCMFPFLPAWSGNMCENLHSCFRSVGILKSLVSNISNLMSLMNAIQNEVSECYLSALLLAPPKAISWG